MKIALVCPYDYSFPGGVANHMSHLDEHLTRMGHEVKILAPCSKHVEGAEVIPLGKPVPIPTSGSIARIGFAFLSSFRVKAILKKEKFDIIHIHEPLTPMVPLVVLSMSQAVNVGTFHAYHDNARGYGLSKPLLNKWFHKLHGKIAVSKPAMDFVSKHFPGDYSIIPNGVDTSHFCPEVTPLKDFRDGKLNILFVGRLEKRKGLNYLLKAYRLIKTEMPGTRLIVVGPGTRLRRGYQRMVKKQGLEDVVFTGGVPYAELPRYYQSADVFCSPATGGESFGIVLLEAMSVGKPIVASDIEGYNELVTSGIHGLLVPSRDENALAQALLTLLRDKSRCQQMGEQGRLKAQAYDWKTISRRIVSYYEEVLARHSS